MEEMEEIGEVFRYFAKVGVAAIRITKGTLSVGDTILIRGATTNFTQRIDSMQIERQNVETASEGQDVGIKVIDKVREKDMVYKINKMS